MLAVGLDDELVVLLGHGLREKGAQLCLEAGVEVQLGLLDQYGAVLKGQALHYDGQDLAEAEASISQAH